MNEYLRRGENLGGPEGLLIGLLAVAPPNPENRLASRIVLENIAMGQKVSAMHEAAALVLAWSDAERLPPDALTRIREIYEQEKLFRIWLLPLLRRDPSPATIKLLLKDGLPRADVHDRWLLDALRDLSARLWAAEARCFSAVGELIEPPSADWPADPSF